MALDGVFAHFWATFSHGSGVQSVQEVQVHVPRLSGRGLSVSGPLAFEGQIDI